MEQVDYEEPGLLHWEVELLPEEMIVQESLLWVWKTENIPTLTDYPLVNCAKHRDVFRVSSLDSSECSNIQPKTEKVWRLCFQLSTNSKQKKKYEYTVHVRQQTEWSNNTNILTHPWSREIECNLPIVKSTHVIYLLSSAFSSRSHVGTRSFSSVTRFTSERFTNDLSLITGSDPAQISREECCLSSANEQRLVVRKIGHPSQITAVGKDTTTAWRLSIVYENI